MLFNTLKQQSSTSCVSAKARGLSSFAALIALKYPKTSLTFAVYLISTTGPNPTGRCNGCTSCHSGRCDSGVQSSELSSSEDDVVMAGVMRICQWHMWRGASYIQLQQAHSESMCWSAVGTMRCVYTYLSSSKSLRVALRLTRTVSISAAEPVYVIAQLIPKG